MMPGWSFHPKLEVKAPKPAFDPFLPHNLVLWAENFFGPTRFCLAAKSISARPGGGGPQSGWKALAGRKVLAGWTLQGRVWPKKFPGRHAGGGSLPARHTPLGGVLAPQEDRQQQQAVLLHPAGLHHEGQRPGGGLGKGPGGQLTPPRSVWNRLRSINTRIRADINEGRAGTHRTIGTFSPLS